jgi:hypothetical protein
MSEQQNSTTEAFVKGDRVKVTALMPEGRDTSQVQREIGDRVVTYVREDIHDPVLRHLVQTDPDNETTTVWVHAVERAPEATPAGPDLFPRADVERMIREAEDRARREVRAAMTAEFDRWKENATEIAHTYAEENSLCGEFDRAMEEIGLRPRARDYTVVVSVSRTITASSEEDARDLAREEVDDLTPEWGPAEVTASWSD